MLVKILLRFVDILQQSLLARHDLPVSVSQVSLPIALYDSLRCLCLSIFLKQVMRLPHISIVSTDCLQGLFYMCDMWIVVCCIR
jgi:hypothetical protein